MIKKSVKKHLDGYLQQAQNNMSTYMLNHPQHCLTNMSFCLARRISTITDNEKLKYKCFKELKKSIARTKIH